MTTFVFCLPPNTYMFFNLFSLSVTCIGYSREINRFLVLRESMTNN
jgi:hypothetical protein